MASDILDGARAIPGVQSVAMTSLAPIVGGRGATDDVTIPGFTSTDPVSSGPGLLVNAPVPSPERTIDWLAFTTGTRMSGCPSAFRSPTATRSGLLAIA